MARILYRGFDPIANYLFVGDQLKKLEILRIFAGTEEMVALLSRQQSECLDAIGVSPNTSFQRTLTRGGFGPLNSDR